MSEVGSDVTGRDGEIIPQITEGVFAGRTLWPGRAMDPRWPDLTLGSG